MKKEDVKDLFDSKFIHVYDLQYAEGKHYYDATRRDVDHIAALKTEEEFRRMLPDAVSCFVILRTKAEGNRLLLSYEYRYPAGQYLLSVPAGLIDPEDVESVQSDNASSADGDSSLSAETGPMNEDRDQTATVEDRDQKSESEHSSDSDGSLKAEWNRSSNYKKVILEAARREIHEETNLLLKDTDRLEVVNPLVFSTPGMTDESNALVLAVVHLDDLSVLNQKGAVGSEKFDGFALLSQDDAERILKNGVDDHGHFYPLYTWAALMYFVTGRWE